MMDLQDCFVNGMIRKSAPDINKAKNSIKIAERKIEEAKKISNAGVFDLALVTAYTAMFHAARALLFKDGYKERSHFCLCTYVKATYSGRIEAKYLNELDILREQRHMALYGDENLVLKDVEESEAESAIKLAEGFLAVVKKLIA